MTSNLMRYFTPLSRSTMNVKGAILSWNIKGSQINKITATAIIALSQNVLLLFYKFCFAFLGGLRPPQSNCILYEGHVNQTGLTFSRMPRQNNNVLTTPT